MVCTCRCTEHCSMTSENWLTVSSECSDSSHYRLLKSEICSIKPLGWGWGWGPGGRRGGVMITMTPSQYCWMNKMTYKLFLKSSNDTVRPLFCDLQQEFKSNTLRTEYYHHWSELYTYQAKLKKDSFWPYYVLATVPCTVEGHPLLQSRIWTYCEISYIQCRPKSTEQ